MDDYQDQATWYEVQENGPAGWTTVADADTREDADRIKERFELRLPGQYRTKRVRGLA